MSPTNELGQSIGRALGDWRPPEPLSPALLVGRWVSLRPLDVGDAPDIHAAFAEAPDEMFTYMSFEPFRDEQDTAGLIRFMGAQPDWIGYVIVASGNVDGFAAFLRINPGDGVAEIGSIMFSPRLQRTTAATEAIFLMLDHAFSSGYRRVEWKCDALNHASRVAADRLGFTYEGTFRNATHYKDRNRDTAWFAMIVEEWETHRTAFERWLDPANFDDSGGQLRSLAAIRADTSHG